jgi:hypothetical protein
MAAGLELGKARDEKGNIIDCALLVWSMFQLMKRAHLVGLGEGLGAVLHFGAALRNMRKEAGTEKAVAAARDQGH